MKIHSTRFRNAKWNLSLSVKDARKNGELVSLADSQVLRWIDELNGVTDVDARADEIKRQIVELRRQTASPQTRKEIKKLYAEMDRLLLKPDYLLIIIDRDHDYRVACGGLTLNGVKYVRLLGTNGGIKNNTIVFVSERLSAELRKRIDNGRDLSKELVPAKLEAYRALSCSASTAVSDPRGILVVPDCETQFVSPTLYLSDERDGEPVMEFQEATSVTLNASDGCGMILPSLIARWSEELGLGYITSGVNSRYSWEKGMLFAFDFVDFAEKKAHTYFVKDAWGEMVDVRDVDIVLTTSMLKLWDSYKSCADYLRCCKENHYEFSITKVCPEKLENERYLNYQFIQSFEMSDDDIDELISPTVNLFKDVLGGDWRKTVLFLQGTEMDERRAKKLPGSIGKAIMADHRVIGDPYIQNYIYTVLKNRINEAKTGVLKIHGNYSIACGDLFALCQSMFGMTVTGILKAGEIYNSYWAQVEATSLLCFRAPMSVHNNVRKVHVNQSEDALYWFRHIRSGTVFNSWDTASAALNGMDYDGDLVMLTDNQVLLRNHRDLPALMCIQRKATKRIPSEADLVRSNIESFGNEIGSTTNKITSMYDVISKYQPGTEEYEVLSYRIKCGQLYQQNCIDKAKGIIAKPMPKEWYDRFAVSRIDDPEKKRLYMSIVAEKKPYFMRYIYPKLMREYNEYIKRATRNALREFNMTVDELRSTTYTQLTDRQREFLRFYEIKMPVSMGNCVMNKICKRFEDEFDSSLVRFQGVPAFQYECYKSGVSYTKDQFNKIRRLHQDFNKSLQNYQVFLNYEHLSADDTVENRSSIWSHFIRECFCACQNAMQMCDILIDVCYSGRQSKHFVWEACADEIVRNLLRHNGNVLSVPIRDDHGDIEFGGDRFSILSVSVGGENE